MCAHDDTADLEIVVPFESKSIDQPSDALLVNTNYFVR